MLLGISHEYITCNIFSGSLLYKMHKIRQIFASKYFVSYTHKKHLPKSWEGSYNMKCIFGIITLVYFSMNAVLSRAAG